MKGAGVREGGLTLIELIVFIVVVSVGLLGLLSVFNLTVRGSADPMVQKQMLAIAEGMLDEILLKDFQNDPAGDHAATPTLGCTPSTSPACPTNSPAARQYYNDVDDYAGYGVGVAGIYDITGDPIPALGAYSVAVSVDRGSSLGALSGAATVKHVAVTVSRGGESITLDGYRTNYCKGAAYGC